ncbi:MAG: hypothetical protein HOM52_06420 [Rhodospirillaceae bacterium]|jgi:hypothetical protein|nr:hypothetical protein [Rhodospirillaceae bacterium]MBT4427980.1 hypothetical protein [Rhodospirillaceae bacterium]MBT5038126.1 hypothetical protein [Rhodospirillaceae bacterium]MBT5677310.1 hypothetical protein [Rhodospirillaceae bacterium]MBT5781181.1 hypothetical protein [Rhodospirillaceae bacterium]
MAVNTPQDAHRQLVTEAEHSWTLGLMAYAIVEDQKYEWIAHLKETEGREPTTTEIENWFRSRTPESFTRVVADAEHALQLVADDALEEIIGDERRGAFESGIVEAVNGMTGSWRQFGIGIGASLVGAILFAILILVVAFIAIDNRSIVDLVKESPNDHVEQHEAE